MKANSVFPPSITARRKMVSVSSEDLVKFRALSPGERLPLVIEPAERNMSVTAWLTANREIVDARLDEHGAILFRGFNLSTPAHFEQFVKATGEAPMPYTERSSPRHEVGNEIYTSTDYPASQSIFPHHEHSYKRTFPLRLFFFCETPAQYGGETPLADGRRVLKHISPATRETFEQKGWLYVRNFGDRFGLNWQTAFQTSDRSQVEEYCQENKIECQWRSNGFLRTRQVRPALARHPRTGEMLWFNHAAFFHVSTLGDEIREVLLAKFGEEDLPNNAYYGDGSTIEPEVAQELRLAYQQELVTFSWQRGDVVLVDNMLTAHARAPFRGARRVLVAMTMPVTRDDL